MSETPVGISIRMIFPLSVDISGMHMLTVLTDHHFLLLHVRGLSFLVLAETNEC